MPISDQQPVKWERKRGICEHCGNEFISKRRGVDQRFCSTKCRGNNWVDRHRAPSDIESVYRAIQRLKRRHPEAKAALDRTLKLLNRLDRPGGESR